MRTARPEALRAAPFTHERNLILRLAFHKLRVRTVLKVLLIGVMLWDLCSPAARAADPIVYVEKQRLWVLQSGAATYRLWGE